MKHWLVRQKVYFWLCLDSLSLLGLRFRNVADKLAVDYLFLFLPVPALMSALKKTAAQQSKRRHLLMSS